MRRDTFQLNKDRQQYQTPFERDGCHNCMHVSPLSGQCGVGGFYTHPHSVCNKHERAPAPKAAA